MTDSLGSVDDDLATSLAREMGGDRRVVVEQTQTGDAFATINGIRYKVVPASTTEGSHWIPAILVSGSSDD